MSSQEEVTKENVKIMMREDEIQIPSQQYALVSFVSPVNEQKYTHIAMKIRGVFRTREEAEDHCKKVMKNDPYFDVYVVDLYQWLVVPPNREMVKDQVYQEEFLNNMMSEYDQEKDRIKQVFEERKEALKSRPDVNKVAMETGLSTQDIMDAIEDKSTHKMFTDTDPRTNPEHSVYPLETDASKELTESSKGESSN